VIVALAGGVGGAKLALGLSRVLPEDRLLVAINTGDDFVHLGLHVSPDLDTVMYTLAGLANPETGWGLANETWRFMEALKRLGGEAWFQLGDQDLATHVERTRRLAAGEPLSAVTADLARRLGVRHAIAPISDNALRTIVLSKDRAYAFQEYFVREKAQPELHAVRYDGAAEAALAPAVQAALTSAGLRGVIICPSNPFLSIGPMLAIPGLREALRARRTRAIAVSPIIGGKAVKGPAAKILRELGQDVSPVSIARYYAGLIDVLLIDHEDAACAAEISSLGIEPVVTPILMQTLEDRERLANMCVHSLQ